MLRDKIYEMIKSKHKRISDCVSKSVTNRIVENIITRKYTGEFISIRLVNDELIEAFIKSYIRHKETGYDMLLKRGVPRNVARNQISNYVNERYKWMTRKY
jgi:hypothetical protein